MRRSPGSRARRAGAPRPLPPRRRAGGARRSGRRAAAAVGISRSLAAFHLDKLAAAGLLDVEYRRPPGRSGPGAGRPAKLYRRTGRQLDVTLPPRRYDLAGRILADAVAATDDDRRSIDASLTRSARQVGVELAAEARDRAGRRPSRRGLDAVATTVLEAHGYEPAAAGGGVVLRNCPFHALAQAHTALICGINADLLGGFIDELPSSARRSAGSRAWSLLRHPVASGAGGRSPRTCVADSIEHMYGLGMDLEPDLSIEERLRVVCGHLNVLHAQLVDLAAEAMDTGVWAGWGVRSMAHWLTWQAGCRQGGRRRWSAWPRRGRRIRR